MSAEPFFIEVIAENAGLASQLIKAAAPPGAFFYEDRVYQVNRISDNPKITLQATAETIEAAYAQVETELRTKERSKYWVNREIWQPNGEKQVLLYADSPEHARQIALSNLDKSNQERLVGIRMVEAGRKGVFGIGKQQDRYAATIAWPATVAFSYQSMPTFRVMVYPRECELQFVMEKAQPWDYLELAHKWKAALVPYMLNVASIIPNNETQPENYGSCAIQALIFILETDAAAIPDAELEKLAAFTGAVDTLWDNHYTYDRESVSTQVKVDCSAVNRLAQAEQQRRARP